jgi:hypothetical protein
MEEKILHTIPTSEIIRSVSIDELTCCICLGITYKPVMTSCCEQLVCYQCIKILIKGNEQCPMCKETICFSQVPKVLLRILNNLLLKCPFEKMGCKEELKYEFYYKHIFDDCPFLKFDKESFKQLSYCGECGEVHKRHMQSPHLCYKTENVLNRAEKRFKDFSESFFRSNSLPNKTVKEYKSTDVSNQNFNSYHRASKVHSHSLTYSNNFTDLGYIYLGWTCDICKETFDKEDKSHHCKECLFDVCNECLSRVLKKNENFHLHPEHELILTQTYDWNCKNCNNHFSNSRSWRCSRCNFNACIKCYWN